MWIDIRTKYFKILAWEVIYTQVIQHFAANRILVEIKLLLYYCAILSSSSGSCLQLSCLSYFPQLGDTALSSIRELFQGWSTTVYFQRYGFDQQRLIWYVVRLWNLMCCTPYSTGEQHTTSTLVDQTRIQLPRQRRKNSFFSKLVFQCTSNDVRNV